MLERQRLGTFLLGTVAGVIAGVLLTPRSGREIRNTLANRTGELRERGREGYFEAQERLQERLAGSGGRPSGGTVEAGRMSAGGPQESPEEEELRERIRQTRARIRAQMEQSRRPE